MPSDHSSTLNAIKSKISLAKRTPASTVLGVDPVGDGDATATRCGYHTHVTLA